MGAAVIPYIPSIIAAVGAGASVYSAERSASKQDQQLAQQITRQGETQREIDARLNQALQEQAKSNNEDERQSALAGYMDQLAAANANRATKAGPGAFSNAFLTDAENAAAGVADYGATRAGQMARIDSAVRQRENEGVLFNKALADIGLLKRDSAGMDFLDQLRLKSIRPDPWINAFGSAMQGAGRQMASNGWGSDGGAGSYMDASRGLGPGEWMS